MTNWYTNKEQSIALSEFLPRDSANLMYRHGLKEPTDYIDKLFRGEPWIMNKDLFERGDDLPCWSVEALLKVMPSINGKKPWLLLDCPCITYCGDNGFVMFGENILDACYKTIIKLHQENYI